MIIPYELIDYIPFIPPIELQKSNYVAGVDVHEQRTKTNTLVKFSVKKLWHSITELFT